MEQVRKIDWGKSDYSAIYFPETGEVYTMEQWKKLGFHSEAEWKKWKRDQERTIQRERKFYWTIGFIVLIFSILSALRLIGVPLPWE